MPANDRPLFEADGVEVGYADFARALPELGVRQGATLFVHSDVATFGRLLTDDRNVVMETICAALMNAVGELGTIIMPTFTYSFCNGETFDLDRSKSTVGSLTEYFRVRPDAVRTRHAIFSVAIWGQDRRWYQDVGRDSFDEDSIFGKLRARNGQILFLGVPFRLACTFVHHIEQMHVVPYRYLKEFSGVVRAGDTESHETFTYYVRQLDRNVNTDLSRFEQRLLDSGLMREGRIGRAGVWLVDADALYQEGRRFLAADVRGFLEGEGPNAVPVLPER